MTLPANVPILVIVVVNHLTMAMRWVGTKNIVAKQNLLAERKNHLEKIVGVNQKAVGMMVIILQVVEILKILKTFGIPLQIHGDIAMVFFFVRQCNGRFLQSKTLIFIQIKWKKEGIEIISPSRTVFVFRCFSFN